MAAPLPKVQPFKGYQHEAFLIPYDIYQAKGFIYHQPLTFTGETVWTFRHLHEPRYQAYESLPDHLGQDCAAYRPA